MIIIKHSLKHLLKKKTQKQKKQKIQFTTTRRSIRQHTYTLPQLSNHLAKSCGVLGTSFWTCRWQREQRVCLGFTHFIGLAGKPAHDTALEVIPISCAAL